MNSAWSQTVRLVTTFLLSRGFLVDRDEENHKRELNLHSHKLLSYTVGHLNHSSCLLPHNLVDQSRINFIPVLSCPQ